MSAPTGSTSGLIVVAAALACLAGCAVPEPEPRPDRTAPVILPKGYTDPAVHSPPVPGCDDPGRSLNPAGLQHGADGSPEGPALSRIRDVDKRLVVGVSQTAPLFSHRDLVTGEMKGFEVEIVNRIAEELFGEPLRPEDPRLRLVTVPTGSRLYALDTTKNRAARAGKPELRDIPTVDMVIADVSVTCGRVATYGLRYSTPYLATNTGLMVRRGLENIRGPDDLGGRKVCSGTATTNSDEMIEIRDRQKAQGLPQVLPVSVSDTSECLMLLQRGLVDAIYTDVQILEGFRQQDPGTVLLDYRDPGQGEAGIAISGEDEDLVRFVNGVLDQMRADKSLQKSYDKWFSTVTGRHPLPAARYSDLAPLWRRYRG